MVCAACLVLHKGDVNVVLPTTVRYRVHLECVCSYGTSVHVTCIVSLWH